MKEYLIINYISFSDDEITIGATDSQRWKWDIEGGFSGADARTMVWVILKDNGSGIVPSESVRFFCDREEPLRLLAYDGIAELFKVAWEIKDLKLTPGEASIKFFGFEILNNS